MLWDEVKGLSEDGGGISCEENLRKAKKNGGEALIGEVWLGSALCFQFLSNCYCY